MTLKTRLMIAVSVLIAWNVHFFFSSVPHGFENPWKMRVFTGIHKMTSFMARAGEMMGVDDFVHMMRRMIPAPKAKDPELLENVKASDHVFDGVPVRVYRPSAESSTGALPAWVYYHGGAWVMGSVAQYDVFCRRAVIGTGAAVVSVEYRLAPEHPYPAGLDDCHKATLYVLEHAVELAFDPLKVLVGGDSAGGTLAAAVALRMNKSTPPLAAQILIYPSLQSVTFNLPSFSQPWTPLLDRSRMLSFRLLYFLGHHNSSWPEVLNRDGHVSDQVRQRYADYVDYRKLPEEFRREYVEHKPASVDQELTTILEPYVTNVELNPLLNPQLTGLAETLIVTAGYDPLRDEGFLYAMRLRSEGIDVEHLHYEQGFHGMVAMTEGPLRFDVGVRARTDIFNFIRNRLAR